MKPITKVGKARYQSRRKRLLESVGEGGIVIVAAATEKVRSRDTYYAFRQDSDLLYLTGFEEPEAILVLVPGRKHGECILFCRDRDPHREAWDGARLGPDGAPDALGIDDAYPITDIDDILPGLIEGRGRIFAHFGRDSEFDSRLMSWLNRTRAMMHMGNPPPRELLDLSVLINEQRLIKDKDELLLMRRAADIAVLGHEAAMRAVQPGMYEYQLQAELERVFKWHDATPAYTSIVGAGSNGCVLHYVTNRDRIGKNDLVLIDAGAEYRGYASDITRTFPAGGRFSKAQRQLHDVVVKANRAALAQVEPGAVYELQHLAAVTTLTEGLLELGLLKGKLETLVRNGAYKRFYPHKTGHWLGLDTHDVGDYRIDGESRILEPGMVFTIEPGLYIPHDATEVDAKWRGIGIRIEDDVLVTETGYDVLTDALVRDADSIEQFMAANNVNN